MLMKIKDTHILYINLKEDTEKRKRIEHQLDSLKLNYTRVEAIRGSKLKNLVYRKKISNGKRYKRLLILENLNFLPPFLKILEY